MAMRRSFARWAMALTSASVGLRSSNRSVSRTKGLAWCNVDVGVGMSCNMSGSSRDAFFLRFTIGACSGRKTGVHSCGTRARKKGGRFPASPLEPFLDSAGSTGPGGLHLVHRLLGRSLGHREYRHEGAAACFGTKLDMAFDLGEQGMIGAHADIKAGMPRGAALARNDVTGNDVLAAVGLDPEPLARRISPVTR